MSQYVGTVTIRERLGTVGFDAPKDAVFIAVECRGRMLTFHYLAEIGRTNRITHFVEIVTASTEVGPHLGFVGLYRVDGGARYVFADRYASRRDDGT